MIVKGIIKTINYNDNSCTVRLPLFETVATSGEVILSAVFMSQPGMYNGYAENDVVFVDFENDSLDSPIVIGKLYLGATAETASAKKGGITVSSLNVSSDATLPVDTKIAVDRVETVAEVDGGITSYKSIADMIKALRNTGSSIERLDKQNDELKDEGIASIKVEYLSQPRENQAPLANDKAWQISSPEYKDGYAIWQKTTWLNYRGQILNTEIICLSELASSATYRIKCSTRAHYGKQQKNVLVVTAMAKFGSDFETKDTREGISLIYKWGSDGEENTVDDSEFKIELANIENETLFITAKYNNEEYDTETITYVPLNTPTLSLSHDSSFIEYDSYGLRKIDPSSFVQSTASVKLNNEEVEDVEFCWEVDGCTAKDNVVNQKTIVITNIDQDVDIAYAVCEATYKDNLGQNKTLTKTFTIAKNKQGKSFYKIDIFNDSVTISTDENGTITDSIKELLPKWSSHDLSCYYGDDPLQISEYINVTDVNFSDWQNDTNFRVVYTTQNVEIIVDDAPTFAIKDLTDNIGYITYVLYRGTNRVAVAKFEIAKQPQGVAATSYWIDYSARIHKGTNQQDGITATAWKKYGNSSSVQNNDVSIRYGWRQEDGNFSEYSEPNAGQITVNKDSFKNADLIFELGTIDENGNFVISESDSEFEVITYSPLNTPVLDLSNDSADLTYKPNGEKIGTDEVSCIATVFLNGEVLTEGVNYAWTPTDEGTVVKEIRENNKVIGCKITVSELASNTVEFTCTATINNPAVFKSEIKLQKVFTVSRQIQGENSISYWLKLSSGVHLGANQKTAITVTAMQKVGTNAIEDLDESAILEYSFTGTETDWHLVPSRVVVVGEDTNKYYDTFDSSTIENFSFEDKDLLIRARHGDIIYETETITYSPLNTPVLDLDNDTDTILYPAKAEDDTNGPLGTPVKSKATLYLNGDPLAADYEWSFINCVGECDEDDPQTVYVNAILGSLEEGYVANEQPRAICTATVTVDVPFKDKEYTKAFTVSKTRKGDNAIAYSLVLNHSSIKVNTNLGTKVPEKLVGTWYIHDGESIQPFNTNFEYKIDTNVNFIKKETDENGKFEISTEDIDTEIVLQLKVNDTIVKNETISVIRDGENAVSPYTIDIYNDQASVLSETTDLVGYDWKTNTTHKIKVLQGAELINSKNIIVKNADEYEPNPNDGLVLTYALININTEQFNEDAHTNTEKIYFINGTEDAKILNSKVEYNLYYQGILVATNKFEFLRIMTGISITGVTNRYYATANADADQENPQNGGEKLPDVKDTKWKSSISDTDYGDTKPYLWNYEIIEYSSGDPTITDPALLGSRGKGIKAISEYYLLTITSDTPNPPTKDNLGNWKTDTTQPTADNPYLWNTERIDYTDGDVEFTEPALIGTYSRSINEVKNYYYATSSETDTIPTKGSTDWKTSIADTGFDAVNKYLWNYEEITYDRSITDGTTNKSKSTEPEIISIWSKEIDHIEEKYLISKSMDSASFETADNKEDDWATELKVPTSEYPYLWNKEITYYTDNTTNETAPIILSAFARSIIGVKNYYLTTTTNSVNITHENTAWVESISEANFNAVNKYLWNYEEIQYDLPLANGEIITKTDPEIISTWSKEIDHIEEYYLISKSGNFTDFNTVDNRSADWTTSIISPTSSYPYLWNKEVTYFTDETFEETNPVIIGTFSRSIIGIKNYYFATKTEDEKPSYATAGWKESADAAGFDAENRYLWNYEEVQYDRPLDDGSTVKKTPIELISVWSKSIDKIEEFYLLSKSNEDISFNDESNRYQDWDITALVPNSSYPYLWNKEKTTYTDGEVKETNAIIIGTYGETFGVNIVTNVSSISVNKNTNPITITPNKLEIQFNEVSGSNVIPCAKSNRRYKAYTKACYTSGTETDYKDPFYLDATDANGNLKYENGFEIDISSFTGTYYKSILIKLYLVDSTNKESLVASENIPLISDGINGTNAINYWLNIPVEVHKGSKHGENIVVTAMKQTNGAESTDTNAILFYRYDTTSNWTRAATHHRLNFNYASKIHDNKDIYILATHKTKYKTELPANSVNGVDEDFYDYEVIQYSPVNSPILILTNDSASLPYNADGTPIGIKDYNKVTTTAELWLNGSRIQSGVSYEWATSNCGIMGPNSNKNNQTITITSIGTSSHVGTATCNATYKNETYTKTFTVTKQFKGNNGDDGVNIDSQITYYALIHPTISAGYVITPENTDEGLIIKAYKLLEDGTKQNYELYSTWSAEENWNTTPPKHTQTTISEGWKYWTTVRTENSIGNSWFSTPIINEDIVGAYELAQGKTTNYYSSSDPAGNKDTDGDKYGTVNSSAGKNIKKGDCWFDTSSKYVLVTKDMDPAVNNDSTFSTKEQYVGYYYKLLSGDNYGGPIRSTEDIILAHISGLKAYKKEQNCLKQWTGTDWEDIGGELVANKVTANYINAMDITAKKIEILNNTTSNILFKADGLNGNNEVEIAGFKVNQLNNSAKGLYLPAINNGNDDKITADQNEQYGVGLGTSTGLEDPIFWAGYNGAKKNLVNGNYVYNNDYSAKQPYEANGGWQENTNCYITTAGKLVAKNIEATGGKIAGFDINSTTISSGSFGAEGSVYVSTGIAANKSVGGSGTDWKSWAFTAGDGFGVTTDGTVYASKLNIGFGNSTTTMGEVITNIEEAKSTAAGAASTASSAQSTANSAASTASSAQSTAAGAASTASSAQSTANSAASTASSAQSTANTNAKNIVTINGQITAISAKVNTLEANYAKIQDLEANKVHVKDTDGNTLLLADGYTPKGEISDNERVKIGGFNVDNNSIFSNTSDTNFLSICSKQEEYTYVQPIITTPIPYLVGDTSYISYSSFKKWDDFLEDNIQYCIYGSTNQEQSSTLSVAKLLFNEAVDKFVVYIRSNAERNWDYTIASRLIKSTESKLIPPNSRDSELAINSTYGNGQEDTSIKSYTPVEYTNIEAGDYIYITFVKDKSNAAYEDTGWFAFPIANITINANNTFTVSTDGKIDAVGGKIGGWNISQKNISSNNVELDPEAGILLSGGSQLVIGKTTDGILSSVSTKITEDSLTSSTIISDSILNRRNESIFNLNFTTSSTKEAIISMSLNLGEKTSNHFNGEIYLETNYDVPDYVIKTIFTVDKVVLAHRINNSKVEGGYEVIHYEEKFPTILNKTTGSPCKYYYRVSRDKCFGSEAWINFKKNRSVNYFQVWYTFCGKNYVHEISDTSMESNITKTKKLVTTSISDSDLGRQSLDVGFYHSLIPVKDLTNSNVTFTRENKLGNPSYRWDYIYAKNNVLVDNSSSDIRVKNSIEELSDQYEKFFDELKPRRYKYNFGTSGRYHTGFIAQEVLQSLADSGLDTQQFAGISLNSPGTEDERWYLWKEDFVPLNTWQIQKLKNKVQEQEEQIKKLQQKLDTIEKILEESTKNE